MIWESEISTVKPVLFVSVEVLAICRQAQLIAKNDEFFLLFKARPAEEDGIEVCLPYYAPPQRVSPTSVDFPEPPNWPALREEGFIVCAHSHPFARRTSFSWADEKFINRNFPISILLNSFGEVVDARLTLKLDEKTRVMLHNFEIITPYQNFAEEFLSVIGTRQKEKEVTYESKRSPSEGG